MMDFVFQGLLEKDPVKGAELDDGEHLLERKSEATPVGHKQKVEAGSKPNDVQAAQAVANEFGRLKDKTGRNNSDNPHAKAESETSVSPLDMKRGTTQKDDNTGRRHADKPDGKEHLEKSVSPFDTKRSETQKQVPKLKNKGSRPSEKELMEAVELDIDGLPKDGSSSVKISQTEGKNIVSPIVKPKEAEKEHGIEKENCKGPGYQHRSPMPGRPDYNGRHANIGCKTLGLQKLGPSSQNHSGGKTSNKPPPYSKPNAAKVTNCDEKEESNSFLHGRQQQLEDLGHMVQNGQSTPQRAANVRPSYVNPKVGMHSVIDDSAKPAGSNFKKHNPTEQTSRLAEKYVLRPVSARRKKTQAPGDGYDEAPEKVTSQTPSSHRRPPSKHKGATDAYNENGNGVGGVGNGRNVERAPGNGPNHSGRRNRALYMDDDGSMQRPQAGEDESAIEFGNLLPRSTNGHHRLKSRNNNVHGADLDEEERMMDKLLMHYSKKGLHMDETKTTTGTSRTANGDGGQTQCQQNGSLHPPERAVSLPPESVSTGEAAKVPARSTSLRSECPGIVRVHPKMPDFDELAARVIALRNA
jgi:hypothetical protein